MRNRILLLVAALVLGGLAAVMAGRYLESAKTRIQAEGKPVEVLVATADIPRGLSSEELIDRKLVVKQKVPAQFVSADAVSSSRVIEGQVLSSPLAKGEQITAARFQYPSQAGLAYGVPKNYVAMAIPFDDVRGVAGLVKPGDYVMVTATFANGGDAKSLTRILLPKVKVLAVGATVGSEGGTAPQQPKQGSALAAGARSSNQPQAVARTVTLALQPKDVEKLIYAEETGKVWLALHPSEGTPVPTTAGRTAKTVFER